MTVFYITFILVAAISVFVLYKFFNVNLTALVAGTILSILITSPIYPIWSSVAKNDELTFKEFWNGSELLAEFSEQTCERDGYCENTYDCDPYPVTRIVSSTDSKGNTTTETVTDIHYHSCPYSVQETQYMVDTTLGNYLIGEAQMTGTPFRGSVNIPGGQVVTPPTLWSEAKARIDGGNPGGVTKLSEYKNYILASDATLFKEYSTFIDELEAEGLLPQPASSVRDIYKSDKAYFAGVKNIPASEYVEDVQYLNAQVGSELRGDLHIVFVDAGKVNSPTDYANALKAYWTSELMGKHAIAKNAIVVIVGVGKYVAPAIEKAPDSTLTESSPVDAEEPLNEVVPPSAELAIPVGSPVVEWARMFTGMPLGNEALAVQIQSDMQGLPIDENLIGRPKFNIESGTYTANSGVLHSILFGENKFTRVSMGSSDADDIGSGFSYLEAAWKPSTQSMVGMHVLAIILAGLAMSITCVVAFSYREGEDPLRSLIKKGQL